MADRRERPGRVLLHVLEHGYINAVDRRFITEDGAEELVTATWPDRCYLVEHPDGCLLWDTGLPEAKLLADPLAVDTSRRAITSPLVPWLAGLGVTPDDITYLGFSHLHIDHAGNANQFAGSTVLVSEREHAYAFGPDAGGVYYPEDYAALRDSRTVLIDQTHDVFGDGSVIIHAAPGHSAGHQILYLALDDRQPLLLAGDAWYSAEDRVHRRAAEWNADHEETFRTMDRIEQLAAETGARIFIHHDPDARV